MRDFLIYLLLINATALLLMLIDKQKARRSRCRISESALLWSAILGGSVGALAGMYLFRHKTRHKKFTLGVPAILMVQVALAVLVWLRMGQ